MKFAETLIYNYSLAHRPPEMKAARVKRTMPTSGFRAVIFTMMLCKHLDVYGFGLSGGKGEWLHYYGTSTKHGSVTRFKGAHNPRAEFELLTHWPNVTTSDFYPDFGKLRVFT